MARQAELTHGYAHDLAAIHVVRMHRSIDDNTAAIVQAAAAFEQRLN